MASRTLLICAMGLVGWKAVAVFVFPTSVLGSAWPYFDRVGCQRFWWVLLCLQEAFFFIMLILAVAEGEQLRACSCLGRATGVSVSSFAMLTRWTSVSPLAFLHGIWHQWQCPGADLQPRHDLVSQLDGASLFETSGSCTIASSKGRTKSVCNSTFEFTFFPYFKSWCSEGLSPLTECIFTKWYVLASRFIWRLIFLQLVIPGSNCEIWRITLPFVK